MANGIIISIANNKGGTGKTATAVNLGHGLARLGKKVLVVDNDHQANTTDILLNGVQTMSTLFELIDPYSEDVISPGTCIYETQIKNLYCLPNIDTTSSLEPLLIRSASNGRTLYILRDRLRDYVRENFDVTVIDNPPNLGTFLILSLFASDFVIVPHQSGSKHSLTGLVRAINFIKGIRNEGNPDLRFLRLLITMVDRRTSICRSTISTAEKFLSENEIFKTTIPANTIFQQAESSGQTIIKYRQQASGAQAYIHLAKELVEILETID